MRRFLSLPSDVLLSALILACVDQPTAPAVSLEPGSIAAARANAGGRPIDATFSFDVPAGDVCDFGLHFDATEKERTIELPGDRTLQIFPGALWTVTSVSNGNQETFRIPGSFHTTTLANGNVKTVLTGRNLGFDPVPGFVLMMGTFSIVFDAEGNLIQPLQGSGQLIDVCSLLS
jgi:hypothetical protein